MWMGGVAGLAQDRSVEPAQKSDQVWLARNDAGDYAESWKTSATSSQAAVSEEKWASAMQSARSPLGKVEERKLTSAEYTTKLPGAPDGEYVVAKYATRFEHKQEAVETVISTREKDGSWRVAGYFIR